MRTGDSTLAVRRPSRLAELPELDVTPIMNMFIILIPFLVSLAVFAHVAAQRVGLPSDDAAGVARTAAELPLTVALGADRVVLAWGDHEVGRVSADMGLADLLTRERQRRPDQRQVVVAVDDGVSCATVIGCLDQCRDAGFTDVGLAAGAGLVAPDLEVRP
jgi:biopolymer transport protein ExbD